MRLCASASGMVIKVNSELKWDTCAWLPQLSIPRICANMGGSDKIERKRSFWGRSPAPAGRRHGPCPYHPIGTRLGATTPGPDAPYGKYLDCADHKKPLCPPVDRSRRAYVTLKAILGYGGRAHLVFRTRLATSHC